MKLTDYRNYLSELEKLTERVTFFAWYSHDMYPFNIFFQCGNLKYKEVFDLLHTIVGSKRTESDNEHFEVLAKGIIDYDGTCYSRRDGDILIKVPNIIYTSKGISRVSHEAMHGTILLSEHIGLQLSREGQEAWCYLLDDIVEKYFIFQHDAIEEFLKSPKRTKISLHKR